MRKFTIAILMVCAFGLSLAAGCQSESPAPATNATEAAPAANATAEQLFASLLNVKKPLFWEVFLRLSN